MAVFCSGVDAEEIGCGIEVIPKEKIKYGCGCAYWLETDPILKPILQTGIDGWSVPYVHFKGNLVKAKPIEIENIPDNAKIGDRFNQTFKIEETVLKFENTVSSVCPPDSEGCEVTNFKTNVIINGPKCKIEIKGIQGDCGC